MGQILNVLGGPALWGFPEGIGSALGEPPAHRGRSQNGSEKGAALYNFTHVPDNETFLEIINKERHQDQERSYNIM